MRATIAFPLLATISTVSLAAQTPDSATLASLHWRSIGPVNMAGRITDVEGDPKNPKTFYVTGATGGVWKTINAGTTFIPLWDHAAHLVDRRHRDRAERSENSLCRHGRE